MNYILNKKAVLSGLLMCFIYSVLHVLPVNAQGVERDLSGDLRESDIYTSDTVFFRATGIGQNSDFRTAERMARLNAASHLAANISVTIESIADRYFVEQNSGSSTEFSSAFIQLTRMVARQQMSNIKVVDNQTEFNNGQFTHRVELKVAAADVLTNLEKDFSTDPSLNHLYDKSLFEEVFFKGINARDSDQEQIN